MWLPLAISLLSPAAVEAPKDTWIFRSVLDKRPRMATANLKDNLWVTYDATHCSLGKFWIGDVDFEGSVYTGEHGPQPISRGTAVVNGPMDRNVWSFSYSDKTAPVQWRGYFLNGRSVTFHYRVPLGKDQFVTIKETPGVTGGRFVRTFNVANLPAGAVLRLDLGDGAFWKNGQKLGSTLTLINGISEISAPYEQARFEDSLEANLADPEPAIQDNPLENGVALRLYDIGVPLSQIPTLVEGQSPNVNVVIPNINLNGDAAFGGLKDYFLAVLTGSLRITEPGTYGFRLTSDDGSRFTIRDTVVVDHDGLHSAEPRDGTFKLDAGDTPFVLEYFENEADQVLKLEWKRPGSSTWELVPNSAFVTPKGEVKVVAPGKKSVLDPGRRNRPGDARPLEGVHPGYDLATVRPKTFRPKVGGIDFMKDGRMVICNWEPEGGVYILSGVNAKDPGNIKVQRYAFGMAEPLGVKVVNDRIFVLQKQELTELIDSNKDGVADEYRSIANGWGVTPNFHEFAFGLVYHKGFFYGNLAIAINPGGKSTQPQNPDRGHVIQIAMDGTYKFVASGLRTPNGIGIGADNEVYLSDNQGDWLPSSKIMHLSMGAFFGSRAVNPERNDVEKPPVVWLPQGEIGNSPGNPTGVTTGIFKGQLLHGDVTHGGVKRVFTEKVNGQVQGCVFRFTQGLEGGINRILFGPNNALFVGGIGSGGNWGQAGKERYGLQRLTPNGKIAFEMKAVRAMKNGMEIEFTKPMAAGIGRSTADYSMRSWKYVPTVEYGGPKVDDKPMAIKSVTVSSDRKRVFLETGTLPKGHVIYVRLGRGLHAADGELAWATEGWYTLNEIPNRMGKVAPAGPDKETGFVTLFDGKDLSAFKGYKRGDVPKGWRIENGNLAFVPGVEGGDIATKESFANFELRLEWKVAPGGNSGIMYRVQEGPNYPWETGAEMQVLDDDRHPDGRNTLTSAGSLYALIPRKYDIVRNANEWNEVRIVANGSKIEHWLNGAKVVEYDRNSDAFKKLIAGSKFASMPQFAKPTSGIIVLQDHGDKVWYRNIRVRRLP